MKLTIEEETGLKFVATKPDETLKDYWLQRVKEALAQEFKSFMDEVSVTMRKLKPGETVVVESRPIKVTLECEAVPPAPKVDEDAH